MLPEQSRVGEAGWWMGVILCRVLDADSADEQVLLGNSTMCKEVLYCIKRLPDSFL